MSRLSPTASKIWRAAPIFLLEVYNRDTNGLLFTEFGPERGHIELAICCSLIVLLGKVQT